MSKNLTNLKLLNSTVHTCFDYTKNELKKNGKYFIYKGHQHCYIYWFMIAQPCNLQVFPVVE